MVFGSTIQKSINLVEGGNSSSNSSNNSTGQSSLAQERADYDTRFESLHRDQRKGQTGQKTLTQNDPWHKYKRPMANML